MPFHKSILETTCNDLATEKAPGKPILRTSAKSSSINLPLIQTGYFELFENPEEQRSCGREARSDFYQNLLNFTKMIFPPFFNPGSFSGETEVKVVIHLFLSGGGWFAVFLDVLLLA